MSSVLKADRKPSHFEVFDKATDIKHELTKYVLKDFAVEEYQNMSLAQKKFLQAKRTHIFVTVDKLESCLRRANKIYIKTYEDYCQRRALQNEALGLCDDVVNTLQTVVTDSGLKINLEKYMTSALVLDDEMNLIKAWQLADNKVADRLFGKRR